MDNPRGLELSPRKVEYLKYIFGRGGTVKTNEIALNFSVDPSTITKTIAELAGAGYLTHAPYRGVALTDAGNQYARFLVKRHRILSLLLVQHGLSEQQACDEVSRFESLVTREAIDMICRASAAGSPTMTDAGMQSRGACEKIIYHE
jgi:Mn-dependent DtxR family transcriptional regulator